MERRRAPPSPTSRVGIIASLGYYGVIRLLFETPSGFAIFALDGLTLLLPGAIEDIWARFCSRIRAKCVWLRDFQVFEDKSCAINHETGICDKLSNMLKLLCHPGQKLAVGKPEYKTIIEAQLGIPCLYDERVMEVMWGIKNLMHSFVPEEKTQLAKEDRLQMSLGLKMLLNRYGFDVKPETYMQLHEQVQGMVLTQSEDRIIWTQTTNGEYSAKSAYEVQFKHLNNCSAATFIWKTKAPPKCKFFAWLLIKERIWTAARLQVRHWPNEYFCQLCLRNLETATHLFVDCPVVRSVWLRVGLWANARFLQPSEWVHSDNVKDWFISIMSRVPAANRKGFRSLVLLTVWEIWNERNRRVFRRRCTDVQGILHSITEQASAWGTAGNRGISLLLPLGQDGDKLGSQQPLVNSVVDFPFHVS